MRRSYQQQVYGDNTVSITFQKSVFKYYYYMVNNERKYVKIALGVVIPKLQNSTIDIVICKIQNRRSGGIAITSLASSK